MINSNPDARSDEYKERFIAYLNDKYQLPKDMAVIELECWLEGYDDGDTADPENDAEECISYWG
jgi:hypothetical protein